MNPTVISAIRAVALTPSEGEAPPTHQPRWPDRETLLRTRRQLAVLPRLVTSDECADLRECLSRVARREAVVVQAGDCAERFSDATTRTVDAKIAQLDGFADRISSAIGLGTVRIGRIAGQYAKPRSSPTETLPDGRLVPSYLGDAVNDFDRLDRREPDPSRLLIAYHCAAFTLRALRASWRDRPPESRMYASHEALLFDYEQPLLAGDTDPFGSSGHLLWIGQRTRQLTGAHIGLVRTLANPIGVKIGPGISPEEAVRLSRTLNPAGVDGKVVFIARFGAGQAATALEPLVAGVAAHGAPVTWLCDPMHGNTFQLGAVKSRAVSEIKAELRVFVRTLRRHGQWPGGTHLECTPEAVTECVPEPTVRATTAFPDYRSACDPRLNAEQAEDVIDHFTSLL